MRFRAFWAPLAILVPAFVILVGGTGGWAQQTIAVVTPSPCPGPIAFGAAEVERAIAAAGGRAARSEGAVPRSFPAIRLVVWSESDPGGPPAPPAPAESYRISRDGRTLSVTGRDAVGTMYGAIDVAEQVRWSRAKPSSLANVRPQTHSPYLELRGVNQFVHKQAMDDPHSWFYSEAFWQQYLDALARSRHNLLDLHALYDLDTTGFPNVFPYLVHLDEYPQADVGIEQTRKNLGVLLRIIAMARDRGIKIGLMNYNAPASVPPGKLADYTAKCVEKLLRDCPDLWAFGFRIGESGQPEDFFKKSYLAGIKASGSQINLYTRSWIASREKIMEIAGGHAGRFLVELKYNGEQLGLPYPVQGERMANWGSYSYQTYTNLPRNYSILWQIRAGGTHRIFQWGDPEFARRTARTCRLGDGAGFSLETMCAYYPIGEYYLNPKSFPQPSFKWEFERDWLWYDVWGRTGYDPDVPDSVFENLFRDRYGDRAGPALFRATVQSSKIVPLIYAYHCLGPDSRDMAPEFETGGGHGGRRNADGSGVRTHPGIESFLRVEPFDDSVMDSPRRYVDHALRGEPGLPFGPFEAARELERAADSAQAEAARSVGVPPSARDASRDATLDVDALAALARYYAAKVRAVTHLEFYNRTGDLASLAEARSGVQQAIAQWEALSRVTEAHFTPINERLRMYTSQFTWREEGQDLPRELEGLDAMYQRAVAALPPAGTAPKLAHAPVRRVAAGDPVTLTVTCLTQDPAVSVALHAHARRGGSAAVPMSLVPGVPHVFTATVPKDLTQSGEVGYYFTARSGAAEATLPERGEHAPYRLLIAGAAAAPSVAEVHASPSADRKTAAITATVAGAPASVALFYRPMPSFYSWQSVPMRRDGAGRCSATVPLTPEGLLYRLAVTDGAGEVIQWPSFLTETPFRSIEPWAPAWVSYGSFELPEGAPTCHPRVGEAVFSDEAATISAIPAGLSDLTGLRFPRALLARAQGQSFGGYPIRFRVGKPTRLFVAFPDYAPGGGYALCARQGLTVGDRQYNILARDYQPGEQVLTFARGPIGIILGFRGIGPGDRPLEYPSVTIGGKTVSDVIQRDFVTVSADCEFYRPVVGARVYTDRQYAILRIPAELTQCLGLRFANDWGKSGDLSLPFRLERPATLYMVFGNADEGAWEKPPRGWRLYARDAYEQGPGDNVSRSVYCRDFPAGDGEIRLPSGTSAILGFKPTATK